MEHGRRWLALALSLGCAPVVGAPACETWWWDFGGKGNDACLQIAESHPLATYLQKQPTWRPGAPRTALGWQPLTAPPQAHRIDGLGAWRLVLLTYDPGHHLIVGARAEGPFRPILLIDGSPAILEQVYAPEVIAWKGETVVHARVLTSGSGKLQASVFLVARGDGVVVLTVDHQPLFARLKERESCPLPGPTSSASTRCASPADWRTLAIGRRAITSRTTRWAPGQSLWRRSARTRRMDRLRRKRVTTRIDGSAIQDSPRA